MTIDETLVRALLVSQHPDLASLPVEPFDAGWDNAVFALGDRWLVRLPNRAESAPLAEKELTWLGVVAQGLPLPVPVPVRAGVPGEGYPWHWSVVPRLEGVTADREALESGQAAVLAGFLKALHRPAPTHAPVNPWRGVPLVSRSDLAGRLEKVLPTVATEPDTVRRLWNRAVAAPPAPTPLWIHGDLHPRNLLVKDGRLAAVLDWGDLTAGDPATDLAAAWMVFDHWSDIDVFLDAYGASADLVRRALGWAVAFATVFLDTGLPDPYPALGRRLFTAVVRYGGGG